MKRYIKAIVSAVNVAVMTFLSFPFVGNAITDDRYDPVITHIAGDINQDGKVSDIDNIIFSRYLAGWDIEIDEFSGDVNQDGKINGTDSIILSRFFAGWSNVSLSGVEMLTITDENSSEYVIVRGKDAIPAEIKASEELQSYLEKIGGVSLRIVTDDTEPAAKEIVIGKTNRESENQFDRSELCAYGFVITTVDKKIFLIGGEKSGTIYSVYEFLEKYTGCRFFTNDSEKIPHYQSISVPAVKNDKQIPVFENRDVYWYDYFNKDIALKRKINGLGTGISEEYGGYIRYSGSQMCHTFNALVNPDVYFESHPEYYSMNENGVRTPSQLCLTNPEVLEIATNTVKSWLQKDPDAQIISVSQNDNLSPCLCDECLKVYREEGEAHSGAILRFVNAIADAVKDEYPNVKIDTFAYQYSRKAPAITKPRENVIVRLCSIECCFSHPMDTCEVAAMPGIHPDNSFTKDLKDWSAISDTLYVWDYTASFSSYQMTFPNLHVIRRNAQLFANNNVVGILEEGVYNQTSLEFGELRMYLLSKILWNPYMSESEYNRYMDEFLEYYYGKGCKYIRDYINLSEKLTEEIHCPCLFKYPNEIYPTTTSETKNKALPDRLTYEMILDYQNTDWTEYLDWYHDIVENPITSEGEKMFDKAAELANDTQKIHIDKSRIQVELMKSWYYYERTKYIEEDMFSLVKNYIDKNGISILGKIKFCNTVAAYVAGNNKMIDGYMEYNKNLYYNRILKYGNCSIGESRLVIKDESSFMLPPTGWK